MTTALPNGADPREIRAGDHLFLVDGSSYIFRAYHALPPLTRKADGLPVGAVSGFCNMLFRLLKDAKKSGAGVEPTHLAVIFDAPGGTFRDDLYDKYKAHRPEAPEDLRPQFGLIREATRAFNVACVEQKGFEADDLIATYTEHARARGADVTIVASDKDLMQLIGPGVVMLDTMKDKRIGPDEVFEKFGVTPDKVVDVQALAGDPVDNVPGVPGIGIKTAASLITEYGDLETLLARAGEIKQPKRRQSLLDNTEAARISMKLVTLARDVPVDTPIEDLAVASIDGVRLVAFLKAMDFGSLTRRVAEATGAVAEAITPAFVPVTHWPPEGAEPSSPPSLSLPLQGGGDAGGATGSPPPSRERWPGAAGSEGGGSDLFGPDATPSGSSTDLQLSSPPPSRGRDREGGLGLATGNAAATLVGTPAAFAAARATQARVPLDTTSYETVSTLARLEAWITEARDLGHVAFDTETTSLDALQAELVGFSLALAPGKACYVPLAHHAGGGGLFDDGLTEGQIPIRDALAALKPLLADPSVLKIGQNLKYDALVLSQYGLDIVGFDDTMLISYALDAGRGGHGMDELSKTWIGHEPITFKSLTGTGKAQVTFDRVAIDKATAYAAEDADVTLRLWRLLKPRLVAEGLTTVYETLERPLVDVIVAMERRGIAIDRQMLARLSGDFAQTMARLESAIETLAGQPFNVASPKQLGEILFDKLGLPAPKKTATGAWATGADILEDLAGQGFELPRKVLDWRQVSKLKSTYTDALPTFENPRTKRVHTSFSLAATTTGRLSSSEPNVQNIPVRTEEGRKIRRAFVATPGHKLISADYSQIELRVLAHIAEVPALRQAFADGIDIHAMTASEMFGVPVAGMDPMIRRRAKAINFGIIYGISAFGLANQLGIGRSEASAYIEKYFQRFPGIRDYMEAVKREARDKGYVTTLFGRRAHYPEIASKNGAVRAFNERAAINAPIQGSAADVIRRAMIRMDAALETAGLKAQMLLQVHDELIFEVPEAEVEATIPLVRRIMEGAAEPAVRLRVPLVVDARAAANWDEAH